MIKSDTACSWLYILTPVAPVWRPNSNILFPLSAQLSPLKCSLHFMLGQPLEVYRLFAPCLCLPQKEQFLNTCFLQDLVTSVFDFCHWFLCKLFDITTSLYIGKKKLRRLLFFIHSISFSSENHPCRCLKIVEQCYVTKSRIKDFSSIKLGTVESVFILLCIM